MRLVLGTMTFGESVFDPDVTSFIDEYLSNGGDEIDTAYVYNEGKCEKLIGAALPNISKPCSIATKVNPRITGRLDGEAAYMQLTESLERLGLDSADTVYLHFPDPATPVQDVLEAMDDLHRQGRFKELGLSNFPAWMVADVWHRCDKSGMIKPTVYEGIYNPLARKAETELNDCLNGFGMRFYAYNPMAGGLLTGRYSSFGDSPDKGRFVNRPNYQKRYWKESSFEALDIIKTAADEEGITTIEATYRWLAYHSMLNEKRGDAIIIGASKLEHLRQNMASVKAGLLSVKMSEAFDKAWEISKGNSPEYFTLYKGKGSVGGEKK